MADLNFPVSPVNGQTYTSGQTTWTYDAAFGVWNITSSGPTGYTGSQGALLPWSVKTANYTAIDGDRILADTSGGTFTITLPATPTNGAYVQISDAEDFNAVNLTVARNGSTIEGLTDDVVLDLKGCTFEFIYNGSTWQVTATTGAQGYVGSIGYTGSQGPIGYTGSQGPIGYSGSQGPIGYTGSAGYTGSQGPTVYPSAGIAVSNGTSWSSSILPGNTGDVLVSNGSFWVSTAISSANVQTFASSGTWTKPSGAKFVLVEMWGAGGGGGRPTTSVSGSSYRGAGGGGGGSYNFQLFAASSLGATEIVTIGAGGAGGATNGASGANGGATNFGTRLYAYGGGGGVSTGAGGAGAGILANASGSTPGGPLIAGSTNTNQNMGGAYGGAGGTAPTSGYSSAYGGGGGSGSFNDPTYPAGTGFLQGGSSAYGGGGGAGSIMLKAISGSTNILCPSYGGGIGATGGSTLNPTANWGQAGSFRSGGGAGAFYDFPNFAMSQSNDYGLAQYVASNGAQVVSIGSAQYIPFIFVSSNGTTTATPYPLPIFYQSTLFGVFYDGTQYVIFSSDGVVKTSTFTSFTFGSLAGTGNGGIGGVSYANGYFFLCRNGGGGNGLFYSTDANTWIAAGVNGDTQRVAYDGTYYYAIVYGGTVFRSSDLTNWTSYSVGMTNIIHIAASPGAVVVGGQGSPYLRISTNQGATWANTTTTFANTVVSLTYIPSQGRWFAATNLPDLWTSTDGTNWVTANLTVSQVKSVTYNGTVYVAAARGSGTAEVFYTATSPTGTWTARTTNGYQTTTGQAGGNGGLGGGGGGAGGGGLTTTGNGGNGGDGYCRVYTW